MTQYLREKTERNEQRETIGATNAKVRYAENETRQHEDHLRHFQVKISLMQIFVLEYFCFS